MQIGKAEIRTFTDADVAAELHAQRFQLADVRVDDGVGQAIGGNAVAEHAAGLGQRFEHGDGPAFRGEMPCCGKACRSGADDGRAGEVAHGGPGGKFLQIKIAEELLQRVDVHAFIHGRPAALAFAGMKAHASGQSGEGRAALEHVKRFFKAILLEKVIVGTDIRSGRAGRHAGRHSGCLVSSRNTSRLHDLKHWP